MWSGRPSRSESRAKFTSDHGAITRGDRSNRKLAIVFTGDEYGEGAESIADTLAKHRVKASFFLSGRFYRNPDFSRSVARLKTSGHYLGAHSDGHLLYADWNDRNKTLLTKSEFSSDLERNYAAMKRFGIRRADAPYFLPPYEWYNDEIAGWTTHLGLKLVNFTPGTSSNADYTSPDDKNYLSSDEIFERIKSYEGRDDNGLNGFILLVHIGAGPKRADKFYARLDDLLVWLRSKGYDPVRIDELLKR
jgi:endoglucanase